MKWFGESWGAPVNETNDHAEVPVGKPCLACEGPIDPADRGIILPALTLDPDKPRLVEVPAHLECVLVAVGLPEVRPPLRARS